MNPLKTTSRELTCAICGDYSSIYWEDIKVHHYLAHTEDNPHPSLWQREVTNCRGGEGENTLKTSIQSFGDEVAEMTASGQKKETPLQQQQKQQQKQ